MDGFTIQLESVCFFGYVLLAIFLLVLLYRNYLTYPLQFSPQVALLNLITISSTWARVIDVMDSEVSVLLLRTFCE